jgi:hypothetical protein
MDFGRLPLTADLPPSYIHVKKELIVQMLRIYLSGPVKSTPQREQHGRSHSSRQAMTRLLTSAMVGLRLRPGSPQLGLHGPVGRAWVLLATWTPGPSIGSWRSACRFRHPPCTMRGTPLEPCSASCSWTSMSYSASFGHAQVTTTRIYSDPTDPLTRERWGAWEACYGPRVKPVSRHGTNSRR